MSTDAQQAENTLPPTELITLTKREWEVLMRLANEPTNHELAEVLCITPKSAENYRNRIQGKLALKGHHALARYVRRYEAPLRQCYQLLTGKLPPPLD
jgi:DNA-binding CsgD family transcriptional regulator